MKLCDDSITWGHFFGRMVFTNADYLSTLRCRNFSSQSLIEIHLYVHQKHTESTPLLIQAEDNNSTFTGSGYMSTFLTNTLVDSHSGNFENPCTQYSEDLFVEQS